MSDTNEEEIGPVRQMAIGWVYAAVKLRETGDLLPEMSRVLDRSGASVRLQELAERAAKQSHELADLFIELVEELSWLSNAIDKRDSN